MIRGTSARSRPIQAQCCSLNGADVQFGATSPESPLHDRLSESARLAGSNARIYFLSSTLRGPVVLQYGVRVAVIEAAPATPHLSTEGEGSVAVKVATPSLMRPTTCQVTLPHSPLDVVSEPAMLSPVWFSVQVPPLSGSAHFPLTSLQFTGAEVQYPDRKSVV